MESKVRVIVRIRPFLPGEDPTTKCCTITRKQLLEVANPIQKTRYKFDACYNQDSQQNEIFEEVSETIGDALEGINTTIFAYGMTGAGKTHTMQGKPGNQGIIPRVGRKLMEIANNHDGEYDIFVSYSEIYNEKVFDLLEVKEEDLNIRQVKEEIVIPGLALKKISSFEQFERIYDMGCENRTTAPTGLNVESSRSHAILCLYVQHKKGDELITGKIHLIDLAGSEDNRLTRNKGMRMTESNNINTSLFVLGKVVNALNDGIRVPYRDSKLTRVLQDSLGGRSNAILIANIAPSIHVSTETQRTLNFAAKSRKIVNKPTIHAETIARNDVDPAEERRRKLEEWKKAKGKHPKKNTVAPQVQDKEKENQTPEPKESSDRVEQLLLRMSNLLGNDTNLEDRLLRIEQALKEKDPEPVKVIPMPVDISNTFGKKKKDSSLCLLTPSTKERTAKGFLLAGKEQEQKGQLHNALALYENASKLLPEKNPRLVLKIKKLKELIAEHAVVIPSGPLTPEEIEIQSKKVLRLINTGTIPELSHLHMIAEKRAQLIIKHRPFSSIDDLSRVHGVGKKFVEKFYSLNVSGAGSSP